MFEKQLCKMCVCKFDDTNNNGYLRERNLYGSSRLGQEQLHMELTQAALFRYDGMLDNAYGDKRYELSNHLGNVLQVITDRKLPENDGTNHVAHYLADVVSYSDYFPYGMQMPGRHGSENSDSYRYGFNGMEKDDEVKNIEGSSYDFGARIYDPRVGRWLSIDALEGKKPYLSPYQGLRNNPVIYNDPDGNDEFLTIIFRQKGKADIVLRTGHKISENLRAGVMEIGGGVKYQQQLYDYRSIYVVNVDKAGNITSIDDPYQFTLIDRSRVTITDPSTSYAKNEIVKPSSKWRDWANWEGEGEDQPSGYTWVTPNGGDSPTKTRPLYPTEMRDVEELLNLIGGMKGNPNSEKYEQMKDLYEGGSKLKDVMDKIGGGTSDESKDSKNESVYPGWTPKDTIILNVNKDSSEFVIGTSDPKGNGKTGLHKNTLSKKEVKERYPTVLR